MGRANKNSIAGSFAFFSSVPLLLRTLEWIGLIGDLGSAMSFFEIFIIPYVRWTGVFWLVFCISVSFLIAINFDLIKSRWDKRSANKYRKWNADLVEAVTFIGGRSIHFKGDGRAALAALEEAARAGRVMASGVAEGKWTPKLIPKWAWRFGALDGKSGNLVSRFNREKVLYKNLAFDTREIETVFPTKPTEHSWMST